jgi:RNA polymerase sigma-70 factor (ECF subfamily)
VSPTGKDKSSGHEPSTADGKASVEIAAVRRAVLAVRGGDRESFGSIVELYQRRLFGLTMMMTRHREGAEEVTQDAFVRAFSRLHLYDESRPFYPWIATIAVRLAQNWLSRHGRESKRISPLLEPDREPALPIEPVDALISDERGQQLWQSVAALPSGERTAVALYYRDGMKVNDVARALGVTSGTVKTFLFRARKKLRGALESP